MKDNPLVLIMVVAIAIACVVMAPRIRAAWPDGGINLPAPRSTPSADDAAANATMVARQQLAEIEAGAARAEAQATAQAAAAWATEQAMIADQAHLDQIAARQAESTIQAVNATVWAAQVTAEHERFVATATSAAEATRIQMTAIAATATRQVEVGDMTATIESQNATATRQATRRVEKKEDGKCAMQVAGLYVLVAILVALAAWALWLLCRCLKYAMEYWMKHWPSTWRTTLFFALFVWRKYRRRKE